MSTLELEAAWDAVEGGASLAEACAAAGVRGAARGPLLSDLRRILAGEARLARLAPELRAPERRLLALRALAGEAVGERELARAHVDLPALRAAEVRQLERGDALERLALRGSVSLPVARELAASLGDAAEAFLAASWGLAPLTLRANAARTSRAELAQRLADEGLETEPGRWSPWALVVRAPGPLAPTPSFEEGLFEVQDEASQLVARLVDPQRSAPTVDACAGAGGKTLALCALLGKRGQIVALDASRRRLDELRRRAARAQAFNLLVQHAPRPDEPLSAPLAQLAGRAARVLVDAPCSGLGALRRKPDVARRIDEALLARLPEQQLAIARAAARWLRPGGHLVYATCSPFTCENEAVVARLADGDGLELLPLDAWVPEELGALAPDRGATVLRLLPHVHGTDAFTIHVLRRRS
ncbi:MAG TPA: RsmB/NOP family class I SAM-dependent RNA methyltransferase [Planctomycetota bacterium]